ncbi:hypothetical protein JCM10914A_13420 [Paenibacillus sp. JCM 10914]|uniref:histone acetyltransferase HPA2 and related acetyltransferase n=1 Tax=Paenibacillus sp. JCM 10914 TaxID=1236974 RepID=UPI0003CC2F79|nr:histone acetyltransferase HPA2 and related acetyltransferase [Paenibacillus sp. JCM 10914]GAE08583.1 histone acetyltransferase HPA2 and related acetyltransferases [Paenibacillus sp. JCM 10914]
MTVDNRNRTIPIFDCDYERFDTHLEFYTALGFDITYYQKAPYRFASVAKNGIGEFSFYGVKRYKEEGNIGGCYVVVPNVREIFEELKANLKAYYGRIPYQGTPRISRLNQTAEDWRVNVTDSCGNTMIIGETTGDSTRLMEEEDERVKALESKFEKAYAQAYRFAFSKEDFLAARNTMEVACSKFKEQISNELLFKARILQTEIYLLLGQQEKADGALLEADNIDLTVDEKGRLGEFIERLDELKMEQ